MLCLQGPAVAAQTAKSELRQPQKNFKQYKIPKYDNISLSIHNDAKLPNGVTPEKCAALISEGMKMAERVFGKERVAKLMKTLLGKDARIDIAIVPKGHNKSPVSLYPLGRGGMNGTRIELEPQMMGSRMVAFQAAKWLGQTDSTRTAGLIRQTQLENPSNKDHAAYKSRLEGVSWLSARHMPDRTNLKPENLKVMQEAVIHRGKRTPAGAAVDKWAMAYAAITVRGTKPGPYIANGYQVKSPTGASTEITPALAWKILEGTKEWQAAARLYGGGRR